MPDWPTHREIIEPPVMSGEQIDRLYHILIFGMAVAYVCGAAMFWGFERIFGWCA